MKSRVIFGLVGLLIVTLVAGDVLARGGRGGGGGGRGGGGGGRSTGGGGHSAPSMSRSPSYNRGGQSRGGQSSAGSRQQPSRTQSGNRAGQQPSRGQANNRSAQQPSRGQSGNRAGQQPSRGQANNRAAQQPSRGQEGNRRDSGRVARPSQGEVNNFLNISPSTRTSVAGGAAAGNRTAGPGASDRGPGNQQRDQRVDNRQNRTGTRQDRRDSRPNTPQDRADRRQDRGQSVRGSVNNNQHRIDFRKDHRHASRQRVNRPYRWATWGALGGWYGLSGDGQYYDYGSGGNCYYEDDQVYYEGEPIATAEEYADQAIGFAEAGADTINQAVAAKTDIEWMPLGVFALVYEDEGEPTFYMQLQIAKDGTISGTYVNSAKDTSQTIQGSVDKESQRAAWTVGDNTNTVIETGLVHLTKDEAPALIHFGTEKTQEWLLVRMEDPDAGG